MHEIAELEAQQQLQRLEPLENRILALKYANSTDIGTLINNGNNHLLSARGQVSVDKRTNSLWLRDTAQHLDEITEMVYKLDFPVKQVLIEARIVSVSENFKREIGARFGISNPRHLSGTLEGANQLAQGIAPADVTPISSRLNFDTPSTPLFSTRGGSGIGGLGSLATKALGGSIAFAVARMGGDTVLDLELSALEQEGKVKIVSSPRLITSNQYPAYIQSGEEIPYQEATSSGATSIQFKDAVLSLQVTPQITPDDRIILNLTITKNSAGQTVKLENGGLAIPIRTQEEQSRVLLNDHQTVVLGGIYEQDKETVYTRIPFLGELPLIGYLFKIKRRINNRSELIIFLTPHIIHDPSELT